MTPRLAWFLFGVMVTAWLDLWWLERAEPKPTLTLIQGGRK